MTLPSVGSSIAILVAVAIVSFFMGYGVCKDNWKNAKLQEEFEILKQRDHYFLKYKDYEKQLEELTVQMQEQKDNYEKTISTLNDDHALRLQSSEERANIYKRQAESGTSTAKYLAEHTARLDRQLTEGISLVKELRGVIELRDKQIDTLVKYLEAEKKLNE